MLSKNRSDYGREWAVFERSGGFVGSRKSRESPRTGELARTGAMLSKGNRHISNRTSIPLPACGDQLRKVERQCDALRSESLLHGFLSAYACRKYGSQFFS